ncbi:DUF559 domain-containing protein [Agromyces sp. MMS24-K17]|uniref:DUF559 domain-containing protein n=1 Tax=Agromyces sp. MMS24-K17 TaxID=3372850 RepID=UPI003754485B
MTRFAPSVDLVRRNGGALPLGRLRAAGAHEADIRAALRAGALVRVRHGWLALPDAPIDVVRAVRVGGTLTGSSALRLLGVWLLEDDRLHVRVPPTASRLRSPHGGRELLDASHGVCVHYRHDPLSARGSVRPARDGAITAMAEMFHCNGVVPAMVALESALNRGVLPLQTLDALHGILPAWAKGYLDDVSLESDSGLETIARLLFRRLRIRVRAQVAIAGVRRVDLLVGDRLVLELDGRAFHTGEDFERDRRQDLELTLRGYLVVRLSYRMVVHEWDATHRAVQELVSRTASLGWREPRPAALRRASYRKIGPIPAVSRG